MNLIFFWGSQIIVQVSGGVSGPDTLMFFGPARLAGHLESMGIGGRTHYLQLAWLDLLYPILYAGLFSLVMARGIRCRWGGDAGQMDLVLLPWAAAFSDEIENLSFRFLIEAWPVPSSPWLWVGAVANSCKWFLVLCSLGLAGAALCYELKMLYGIRRRRSHGPPSP